MFAGKSYSVADVLSKIEDRQSRYGRGGNLRSQVYRLIKDYQEEELLAYEKSRLSEKYADFRMLEREYFEGILLFDLTEEKVWRRAMTDTTGLEAFFEENRANYQWDTRYQVYLVDAVNKKMAKKASKYLSKGKSRAEVMEKLNIDSKLNLNIDSALAESSQLGDYKDIILAESEPGRTEVIEVNSRFKQAVILAIEEPRNKELSEAKGRVISDYQTYLEKVWLEELRAKYTVVVDDDVLAEVVSELE